MLPCASENLSVTAVFLNRFVVVERSNDLPHDIVVIEDFRQLCTFGTSP